MITEKRELKNVPIADLIPYARNPRKNDAAVQRVAASLKEYGLVKNSIVVDEDMVLITGHTTTKAMQALKWATAPEVTQVFGLTKAQKKAYRIADNKLGELATWDEELLALEFEDLKGLDFDVDLTGFDTKELAKILDAEKEAHEDDYEPPAVIETDIQRGDLFQLGRHRLLCGDSTSAEDVARLMGGVKADICFTSPPYSDMRTYADGTDVTISKLIQFIPVFKEYVDYQIVNLGIQRKDGAIIQYWDEYIKSAKDVGYKLLSWNVWDKGRGGSVGSMSAMFPIEHEWIFVFGEKPKKLTPTIKNDTAGKKTRWRNMDRTGEYGGYKEGTKSEYGRLGTVVACRMVNKNADHPAQFPIELPTGYIEAMTMVGGIVADPFLGSGTTLVACEQLGRTCYGMEISPQYCQVIIDRWERLTGQKAEKVDGD
jgi:DNA modification methylase